MEFKIKQNVLREELGYIQGVVERKSTIPVLSNILIESLGEGEIRIVGTDLDVTIRCDAEAEIIQPGAICIQARKLFDIAGALNPGDVHFKKEENEWVSLKCGRANYRLAGVSRDQFPEIPQFKSTPLKLPAEVFSFFVRNTAFAITTEQSRFTLSGAKFIVADGTAKLVTTDGHRLAYVERKIDGLEGTIDTLVPKKALLELVKIARGGGDISFGEDNNSIFFETEGRLLITRKLTGNFPNYEMVMPKDNDKTAVFDLEEMKSCIRRMSLIADDRNRSIKIAIRPGEIEVSAHSAENGEGNEIVQADYSGEEVALGFNWQYLLEFLSNVGTVEMIAAESSVDDSVKETDGDKVRVRETAGPVRVAFEFKDPNAQTQLSLAGDSQYDYKYVVMPLRI
jgi:DNA polymerase III subunit beta